MAIVRPIPKIYDFVGSKRAELSSAYNIVETKEFGQINTLTFKYSYYLIDGNGNTVYDENGLPQDDPRTGTIINEFLVEFNDDWYIIKNVEEGRKTDGTKFIEVSCNAKADELTFKQIRYINLTPPIHAPVDAKQAILEVITYPFQVDLGYGKITAASGNVVTLGVTTTFDFTGKKIVTLEGTGKYQQRKIVSYNTTTKQATLDSAFSPQVNTTTVFRVHNSKYVLGYIDPFLINDGAADIFRALKFEDVTIMDALRTISTRFTGFLKFNTTFGGTFNEFNTAIDLRLPNLYNNFEFRYKKNLKGVRRIIDSTAGCFTRLYPEGRNNLSIASVATKTRTDSSITYNEHELGKGDLYNFQYYLALGYSEAQCRDLFIRDFRFIEDAYTTPDALYDGAKKALEEISLPSITYEVEGVDLSVIGVNTSTFGIGDTVQVVDTDLGFDFRATVVSKETDYDTPFAPRIVLSNFTDKFGDLLFKLLKYQEGFANRKALYGKSASIVISDASTSRNWRYADYIIPEDGSVTSDYVIQSAIDELSSNGGGGIYISDGRYNIYNTIDLADNVLLFGAEQSTVFIPMNNVKLFNVASADNVLIKDMKFGYNGSTGNIINYFNGHFDVSNSQNFKVQNCTFSYWDGSTSLILDSVSDSFMVDNMFDTDGNIVSQAILLSENADNFNFYDNNILGLYSSQFLLRTRSPVFDGEVNIYDNYLNVDCSGAVIYMMLIESGTSANSNIFNNTLIQTNPDQLLAFGIRSLSSNISVYGNTLDGCYYLGIAMQGTTGTPQSNVVVDSNVINMVSNEPIASTGINFDVVDDSRISGNTVRFFSNYVSSVGKSLAYGVVISTSNADRNIVSENDLYNSGSVASFLDNGTGTVLLGGNKL